MADVFMPTRITPVLIHGSLLYRIEWLDTSFTEFADTIEAAHARIALRRSLAERAS